MTRKPGRAILRHRTMRPETVEPRAIDLSPKTEAVAQAESDRALLETVELKAELERLRQELAQAREYARREKEYKDLILAWNKRLETQIKRRGAELERLSITDSLSGLYNRRYSFELLERELASASRYGRPLSVLLFDLDDFKLVNEQRGLRLGDAALAEAARTIRMHLRASDLAGRYGGEEFIVILPETGGEGAATLAERIREAIATRSALDSMGVRLSASCGIVALGPEPGAPPCPDAMGILRHADACLAAAKEGGKNRSVAVAIAFSSPSTS